MYICILPGADPNAVPPSLVDFDGADVLKSFEFEDQDFWLNICIMVLFSLSNKLTHISTHAQALAHTHTHKLYGANIKSRIKMSGSASMPDLSLLLKMLYI